MSAADLVGAAPKNGDVKTIEKALNAGADVNHVNPLMGETCLMLASQFGQLDVVKMVLEKKPDLNKKNRRGYTALSYASVKGHLAVAQALLEAGADKTIKNIEGTSPEMLAQTDEMKKLMSTY